jgi:hypothetical protein
VRFINKSLPMKKYLYIPLLAFIFPSIAFAAWWNPATWFSSGNTTATNTVSTMDQSLLNQVNELRQQVDSQQSQNVATATPAVAPITTSGSNLQSKISDLTAENSNLQSKVFSLQTQLQTAQNNYSLCQANSAKIQSSSVQVPPPATNSVPVSNSSSATIAIDTNSPKTQSVEATDIADGQYLALPVLVFDVTPSGNDFYPTSLSVNISASGQGSVSTAYLYQGRPLAGSNATPIATAIVSNGVADFTQINNALTSPTDTGIINAFTIAVDVSGLTTYGYTETVSASVTNLSLVDSKNNTVNATGSVTGKIINVENDI